jgi:hypothetical protein
MIDERVRTVVSRAGDDDRVVLVFNWRLVPPYREMEAKPHDQRRAFMDGWYRQVKSETLDEIRREGAEVVNWLDGTPAAIVAAPARTWRQLVDRSVLTEDRIRITPNTEVTARLG